MRSTPSISPTRGCRASSAPRSTGSGASRSPTPSRARCSPPRRRRGGWRRSATRRRDGLTRLALAVAVVWSISRLVEAVAESVLSYNMLVLTRGLSAIVIAGLAADTFRNLARLSDASSTRDTGRPAARVRLDLSGGDLRLRADRLYRAGDLSRRARPAIRRRASPCSISATRCCRRRCERLLRPESTAAKSLTALLGLRRGGLEQIVVLVQGVGAAVGDRRRAGGGDRAVRHAEPGSARDAAHRLFRRQHRRRHAVRLVAAGGGPSPSC